MPPPISLYLRNLYASIDLQTSEDASPGSLCLAGQLGGRCAAEGGETAEVEGRLLHWLRPERPLAQTEAAIGQLKHSRCELNILMLRRLA